MKLWEQAYALEQRVKQLYVAELGKPHYDGERAVRLCKLWEWAKRRRIRRSTIGTQRRRAA